MTRDAACTCNNDFFDRLISGAIGVNGLPTVAFFPVFDEYGYRMVPDMRLLVPIAPVFITWKDPYVIPISGAEFEVTQ